MSRISQCFKRLKADGQTALISYITAGDPEPWVTVPMLHALVDAGADILELGVPFSDPLSDGPVIQKYYAPFIGGERVVEYRVYKAQFMLNPAISIAAKRTHNWFLYPIGYDRTISEIFDDYQLNGTSDELINRFGISLLYLELLLDYLAIIYILYLFIKT